MDEPAHFLRRLARGGLGVTLLLGWLAPAGPAHAATFTVSTTTDAPHTMPLDGNCTSTLAGSPCTLRAAIQAASFLGGTHTINLAAAGTYTLTVLGAGENAGATGDLDVNNANLTIANTSGGAVTLDGNYTDRVLDVGPVAAAQVAISGVAIQSGRVEDADGGGVRVASGSTLNLTSVTVSNSIAQGTPITGGPLPPVAPPAVGRAASGGGLANLGTINLTDVTIANNLAEGGMSCENGGLGKGGGLANAGTATLANVLVSRNIARGGGGGPPSACGPPIGGHSSGGGMTTSGPTTLTNVTFDGNSALGTFPGGPEGRSRPGGAADGGGLHAISTTSAISLTNVTFINNLARGGRGAGTGFFTTPGGPGGHGRGGGLAADAPATLTNVTFTNNVAQGGDGGQGGFGTVNPQPANGSGGEGRGGGMANGATATLTHVTASHNTAAGGAPGGPPGTAGNSLGANLANAASPAQFSLQRTIVGRGTPAGSNCAGTLTSQGDNLAFASCVASNPALNDRAGLDPLLGTLGSHGGFTPTMPLLTGSPAIDAVMHNGCPPPATDQRGVTRPQGPKCDIGAFEVLPPCAPRPNVGVLTAPNGPGKLLITITATTNASTLSNQLTALQFTSTPGASVDVPSGQQGATGSFTVPLPSGPQQTQFTVNQQTPGQAATVFLTVADGCGDWPTFVGGGPSGFPGGGAAPTSTPSTTPTTPPPAAAATATSTPTPTPTPLASTSAAVACTPRPAIGVTTTRDAQGRLQVTVRASGAGNTLRTLRFGAATNARIEAGAQSGTGDFTMTLPAGTAQTNFVVTSLTAGQAATVPLTVTDACGEWPTLVGGGAGGP